MKIIDLSHEICSGMPVFPGLDAPLIKDIYTIGKNKFAEKSLSIFTHTGTHVDAPAHILKNGKKLDKLPINTFLGKGLLLDFRKLRKEIIEVADIKPYQKKITKTEILLIMTGWYKHWGKNQYFYNFPVLSCDAASYLCTFNLKGIGVDTISIDSVQPISLNNHKVFLDKNIIIIENLTNLHKLINANFIFSCLPLKIKNGDGSPVRAVAICDCKIHKEKEL